MKGQEVVVVREVMEGVLAPTLARAVLLAALDRLARPPEGASEWMVFVERTLREEIAARVGVAESLEVVEQVSSILRSIAGAPGSLSTRPPEPARREREATLQFDRRQGPAKVLVAAASSRLARILKAALGPDVITMSIRNLSSFEEIVQDFYPGLFVVDLTDTARMPLDELSRGLKHLPDHAIVLVWDEGTSEGRVVSEALDRGERRVAWVDRREGVDPLLDHIRASCAVL